MKYLVAEYCPGPIYMGWHMYLRDYRAFRRNKDGGWGWIRQRSLMWEKLLKFLSSIEIEITGDGTRDHDGIAEFAKRWPVKGRRSGGKLRGCVEITIGACGEIRLAEAV